MVGLVPMLSGLSSDEIEYSARLPLPIGERVGVRGPKSLDNADVFPLTRPLRGRPLPTGERWSKPHRLACPTRPELEFSVKGKLSLDHLHPTHIGRERLRHRDCAVTLLVGLHHGDQRA